MLLEYDELAHLQRRKRNVIDIQVKEVRNAVSVFTDETRAIDRAEELKAYTNPEYDEVDVFTTQLK